MSKNHAGTASAVPIQLQSAPNFRDLGGIPTTDGRRIAHGRIYRSEAFSSLQDDQWQVVGDLGVRLVCDLRSPQERTNHPVRWVGEQPRVTELAILPDVRTAGADIMRSIAGDDTGAYARNLLLENYAAMPAAFEAGLRSLIDSIVDRGELPMLISCTAGKDRTGFVCSLLLRALGVAHEDVLADYLRSNESFDPDVIRAATSGWLGSPLEVGPSDAVLEALKVHAEYLESAFASIRQSYGSLDTYLEHAGALNERRRESLRAALLEDG